VESAFLAAVYSAAEFSRGDGFAEALLQRRLVLGGERTHLAE
jgi:hypothetical protein